MIDFHSHILPEIDDGSRSIEETMNLIKEAKEAGFNKIISTSHYIQDEFEYDEQSRKQFVNFINNATKSLGKNTEIYLGSEIYANYNMHELLKGKKASTINNSKYVLLELPMSNEMPNVKNIIYDLIGHGYIPIIAHPERYEYVKENPNWVLDFLELGVMFQANYGSLIGVYGRHAQKTVKLLLKNDVIHFLGSDVHRQNTIYKKMPEIMRELEKTIEKEQINQLTKVNPQLVLDNKDISISIPKKIKTNFW